MSCEKTVITNKTIKNRQRITFKARYLTRGYSSDKRNSEEVLIQSLRQVGTVVRETYVERPWVSFKIVDLTILTGKLILDSLRQVRVFNEAVDRGLSCKNSIEVGHVLS